MNKSEPEHEIIRDSGLFDPEWYSKEYPDVELAGMDPVEHFLLVGASLGRNPSAAFDTSYYLSQNPDVAASSMNPLCHYIWFGARERRLPLPGSSDSKDHRTALGRDPSAFGDIGEKIARTRRYDLWDANKERKFLTRIDHVYGQISDRIDGLSVSIVMPTFNRAESITGAIDSVLRQTHENWQLIIVDDGSTDDTRTVLDSYLQDHRISYVFTENAGVSAARNTGLAQVCGDYVFFLDSDNSWKANHIRSLLVFMDTCDLSAAYCGLEHCDDNGKVLFYRGTDFLWEACLDMNYVDLNCFAHRSDLARVVRFDTDLRRLVDWDYILGITKLHRTAYAPYVGVAYYGGTQGNRITLTEYTQGDLPAVMDGIRDRHRVSKEALAAVRSIHPGEADLAALLVQAPAKHDTVSYRRAARIGYVVWDWPALSQTFVLNEVRWLIQNGYDVRVYYKIDPDMSVDLDFDVEATRVEDSEHLADLVKAHERTALHSPFAYPATTFLTWPAATSAQIPFTFMPGGVDISHYENMKRNRIAEVASSHHCAGVMTIGSYHKDFLLEQGVPSNRIVMERQAADLPDHRPFQRRPGSKFRIAAIGRFVEKKGFKYLVQAAKDLGDAEIVLYGYGPEEQNLRALIGALGLKNVTMAGQLSDKAALHQAYYSADLFVLPCVRAENGDLDGLPTVLLEAMAAGTPVLSTRMANVPDLVCDGVTGFLAEPDSAAALVDAVRRMRGFSPARLSQLVRDADEKARSYASIDQTMSTLLGCWTERSIDIFMVTYDTDRYANQADTIEIIDRIYRFTSMPFNLIVVDNDSSMPFKHAIRERYGQKENFSFVELPENTLCGPASNIALSLGVSDYAVYICSKEGFILKHGWDLEIVRQMDKNPRAAMGGHLISPPQYRTGNEIQDYPSFDKWRNKDFARENPDTVIAHVQGGFYIMRRSSYLETGGFNEAVPHNGTDMELSYYFQSKGYSLLPLENIAAISNKTRPALFTLVDENVLAVHPSMHSEISAFDRVAGRQTQHCVCCGWQGASFESEDTHETQICPSCGADGFARTVWRYLSRSGCLQTRPQANIISNNSGLQKALDTICRAVRRTGFDGGESLPALLQGSGVEPVGAELVIVDHMSWGDDAELARKKLLSIVRDGASVVVGAPLNEDMEDLTCLGAPGDVAIEEIRFVSQTGGFNWRSVVALSSR